MDNEDRILPSTRAALDLSDQERILFLRQPRWIGYTRSKDAISFHPSDAEFAGDW